MVGGSSGREKAGVGVSVVNRCGIREWEYWGMASGWEEKG
jgi:hypothetical protein